MIKNHKANYVDIAITQVLALTSSVPLVVYERAFTLYVCYQMIDMIKNIVKTSFGDTSYPKAILCLKALRKGPC